MRLIFLRSTCEIGRTCPNISITDRGTYMVQGYLVTDLDLDSDFLAPGELVVEIPSSLLPELACEKKPNDSLHRTDRGTILVRGHTVVDADALRELNLPPGEAAVEITISALPELEIAHAE
ncbi:MAG: hypothetical protein ACRDTG_09985 [Pseudonocardiaceae bacterium]